MTETKIFPNAIRLPGGKIDSERLIPFFEATRRSGFLGLKNGKLHRHGLLVSVDTALTAEDILAMYTKNNPLPVSKKECLAVLEKYITALQSFKIGNVISIRYSVAGEFSISKVSETPPVEQSRLL